MILVLGGTSDSIKICKKLNEDFKEDYILSVTTSYGAELAKNSVDKIVIGKLDRIEMIKFIDENNIRLIIDATHPYAIEVSTNAMDCCEDANIPYIRYERKSLLEKLSYNKAYIVENIDKACKLAKDKGQNIFIGTGSKNLPEIVEKIKNKNLIVRVLPTSDVLVSCEKLGLNCDNIIAMKGPFSEKINEEFYKHYNIDLVITKESGIEGGFLEKINACKNLDIPVIIIEREKLKYLNIKNNIDEIIEELTNK